VSLAMIAHRICLSGVEPGWQRKNLFDANLGPRFGVLLAQAEK
jgi:hypothetical protein